MGFFRGKTPFCGVLVGLLPMLVPTAFSQTAESRRGVSEFERYVLQMGGMPASFASFVDRAERLTAYGPLIGLPGDEPLAGGGTGPVVHTYWNPDTRAPEHGDTSLTHPRRIAAVGNTFVGYNESINELQVISWNAAEGRNEFFIVENFGVPGSAPRVRRQPADGGECRTCHTNRGPIMAPFPWAEFNGPDPTDVASVARRIIAARAEAALPALGAPGTGLGADPLIREVYTNATILDDGVRDANLRTGRAAQVCREACGPDPACRRALLLGTLLGSLPTDQRGSRLNEVATELIAATTARWPASGFAFVSDVIRDRDSFDSATRATGGRSTRLRISDPERAWRALQARVAAMGESELTRAFKFQAEARRAMSLLRPEDLAGDGVEERLQYLFRAGVDTAYLFEGVDGATVTAETGVAVGDMPASPSEVRASVGGLAGPAEFFLPPEVAFSDLRACFGFEFIADIDAIRAFPEAVIRERMASAGVVALLEGSAWPPTRDAVLRFLRTGESNDTVHCPAPESPGSQPLTESIVASIRETGAALETILEPDRPRSARQALQTYCAGCHSAESRRPLDLENLRALAAYQDGAVIDRLAGHSRPMPPPISAQPSAAERQAILDALRAAR